MDLGGIERFCGDCNFSFYRPLGFIADLYRDGCTLFGNIGVNLHIGNVNLVPGCKFYCTYYAIPVCLSVVGNRMAPLADVDFDSVVYAERYDVVTGREVTRQVVYMRCAE